MLLTLSAMNNNPTDEDVEKMKEKSNGSVDAIIRDLRRKSENAITLADKLVELQKSERKLTSFKDVIDEIKLFNDAFEEYKQSEEIRQVDLVNQMERLSE